MRQGSLIRLSPKEYNLLTYMVQNAERVISRIEIAEKVWNTTSIPVPTLSMCTSITCAKK